MLTHYCVVGGRADGCGASPRLRVAPEPDTLKRHVARVTCPQTCLECTFYFNVKNLQKPYMIDLGTYITWWSICYLPLRHTTIHKKIKTT